MSKSQSLDLLYTRLSSEREIKDKDKISKFYFLYLFNEKVVMCHTTNYDSQLN